MLSKFIYLLIHYLTSRINNCIKVDFFCCRRTIHKVKIGFWLARLEETESPSGNALAERAGNSDTSILHVHVTIVDNALIQKPTANALAGPSSVNRAQLVATPSRRLEVHLTWAVLALLARIR